MAFRVKSISALSMPEIKKERKYEAGIVMPQIWNLGHLVSLHKLRGTTKATNHVQISKLCCRACEVKYVSRVQKKLSSRVITFCAVNACNLFFAVRRVNYKKKLNFFYFCGKGVYSFFLR